MDQAFTTDMVSFTRTTPDGEVEIQGKIRGLRLDSGRETFVAGDTKRVKIKNCKWSIEESVLLEWLTNYGRSCHP